MSVELQLEKTDIDLNALFNLSYSFENLKGLLTTIIKNQDKMADRIKNLEETEKKTSDVINQNSSNEKRLKTIELIMTKMKNGEPIPSDFDPISNKNLESKASKKIGKEGDVTDGKERKDLKDGGDENGENGDEENYGNQYFDSGFDGEELKKRIDELEQKIKKMELSKFTGGNISSGNNEDIELQKVGLKSLEDKFEEMRLKNDEMTKQIEDLTIKCNDFNIYDLFKDAKVEGGNIDLSKVLVMNLEQKVFKVIGDEYQKMKEKKFSYDIHDFITYGYEFDPKLLIKLKQDDHKFELKKFLNDQKMTMNKSIQKNSSTKLSVISNRGGLYTMNKSDFKNIDKTLK